MIFGNQRAEGKNGWQLWGTKQEVLNHMRGQQQIGKGVEWGRDRYEDACEAGDKRRGQAYGRVQGKQLDGDAKRVRQRWDESANVAGDRPVSDGRREGACRRSLPMS